MRLSPPTRPQTVGVMKSFFIARSTARAVDDLAASWACCPAAPQCTDLCTVWRRGNQIIRLDTLRVFWIGAEPWTQLPNLYVEALKQLWTCCVLSDRLLRPCSHLEWFPLPRVRILFFLWCVWLLADDGELLPLVDQLLFELLLALGLQELLSKGNVREHGGKGPAKLNCCLGAFLWEGKKEDWVSQILKLWKVVLKHMGVFWLSLAAAYCLSWLEPRSHDCTVRGGARMRMTYRASQQFTPQFCGLSRRVMHTWRLCKVRTLDLKRKECKYVYFLSCRARKWVAKKQGKQLAQTAARNPQNAEPGLLVTDASGSRRHTLNGLCQQVNCRQQQRVEPRFISCCHSDPIIRGLADTILTKASCSEEEGSNYVKL